ncbi:MAG: DUF2750 domain-containing protein [Methylotetracoccus sp.]|jgi:hypothetical protein|nr:DUF2750 domain-containing protein [Methylotetracoccus sp.]
MIQLTGDLHANYQRFVENIQESGQVWSLQTPDGWVIVDSAEYEDSEVMPFWSEEAYAKQHCVGEWAHFTPAAIPFDEFVEDWLAGMDEDGVLVGPNWNAELDGLEVEPIEILKLLTVEGQAD